MNYNYLRYFSVLAQLEHYTLAAARLGISQPSLSSAIHQLEDELGGVKLFEKHGRNIRLTEEGRFYQKKVDTALQELYSASMALRDSKDRAPVVIRMGFVSGMLHGTVAEAIAAYAKQNDRIRFCLTETSSEDLMDLVRQEKVDMAIVDTTDRDRTLHFRKLCQRDFCVAFPRSHKLADSPFILPQQIAQESQIVFHQNRQNTFGQWASGTTSEERIVCTVNTAQAALDLVASGIGIALLSDSCIQSREDISFVPLKNWHQALYMCILYDKWLEPPVWDFVETIVRTVRRLESAQT